MFTVHVSFWCYFPKIRVRPSFYTIILSIQQTHKRKSIIEEAKFPIQVNFPQRIYLFLKGAFTQLAWFGSH